MSKRLLPTEDSPEWQEIKALCDAGDIVSLKGLFPQYGYANWDSFTRSLNRQSLYITKSNIKTNIPPPEIVLPLPELREYKGHRPRKGDEETMVLHTGDEHDCKITPTYNHDVCRERFDTTFHSALTIANLHRNMYPINHLVLVNTGDRIQGENPHQGSRIGETEAGARDQVTRYALPLWVELIGSLKQHFKTVRVIFLPGNHGHDKLAPQTSNWDIMLGDLLKAKLEGAWKGVTIDNYSEWYALFDISGFKFFATHMDGIPSMQGVPLLAVNRRLNNWYIQTGGFNYALGGHFHKAWNDYVTGMYEYFGTGSMVSDDEWALKKLGVSSNPSAWVFGVHPVRGVTWRYQLTLDEKYLPMPLSGGLTMNTARP